VPENLTESTRFLLASGADVHASASMYGGSTVDGLVASTGHLREPSVRRELLQILSEAGADIRVPGATVECVTPILRCSDMDAAMVLYVEELGFHVAWTWGDPTDFACVNLGNAEIFLCKDGQGQSGTWMSVFLDDVDAYRAGLTPQHIEILKEPSDEPWRVRECLVRTHDGHVIRFSGPTRGGQ
jgi:catechol 2,3-dioxygenase-like lactoylglutathione lyase family enzyme